MPGDLPPPCPDHSDQLGNRRPDRCRHGCAHRWARATHELLVLERDGQIVGFAYGQPLKRLAPSNGRPRLVPMSTSTITALAEDASSTRSCCAGSPSEAIGKPSSASLNPTRRATAFIDPSGSRAPAYTDAPHGSATAGTTWPRCNSICWTLAAWMDRPARFADRRPAPSGPLRNRQGAMSARTGFAKVKP